MQKDLQLSEVMEAEGNCRDSNDSENKKTLKQLTGFHWPSMMDQLVLFSLILGKHKDT